MAESHQQTNPSFHSLNVPQEPAVGYRCMWGGCNAVEPSSDALILHVNLHHLRSLSSAQVSQQQNNLSNLLSCHWGDCQAYPTPASVPGSSNNPVDAVIGVLINHLYQDHLGLQGSTASLSAITTPPAPVQHVVTRNPPTPPADHDCCSTSVHSCKWEGCAESFATCESLMEHLNASHVGSGKNHYDCYWGDCGRNGDKGFPSKQKICRHIQVGFVFRCVNKLIGHLQSHTGHRPYQCKICNQNFSEAATLQQHMRRHTQESSYLLSPPFERWSDKFTEPYVCDFPGCNKAFAITGALTIHRRIHNGIKPFKCTYCDKCAASSFAYRFI
jgi:uncharacterized Zn-finger protein